MMTKKTQQNWLDLGYSIWWPGEEPLPDEDYLNKIKTAKIFNVETAIIEAGQSPDFKIYEKRLTKLIERFQSSGINVWSVHVPFGIQTDISVPETAEVGIEIIKRQMEVCAKTGVDKVVIHPSSEPIAPEERSARMECCINSLEKLYRPDVITAVETLPRTCLCNTAKETKEVLDALDGKASCCIDVNHCHKEDVAQVIKTLGEYLVTLHISDDDGLDEKHWYPGEGVLNWKSILEALDDVNYKGVFMYELTREKSEAEKIRKNYDWLLTLK